MPEKKLKKKICPPHKYRRRNLSSKETPYLVLACVDCSHYIKPILVVGKVARCFNCNEEFVVDGWKANELAKVRCDNCIKRKPKPVDDKVDSLVDDLLKGL